MRLHLHEWGDPASPTLVCLHGVTAHGLRFRRLAEARLARRFHVLAPDLRGHGHSDWQPPWDVRSQLADVLDTVERERASWLGHSFGARIMMELAARAPERIERAVLLDPAIRLLPHVGLDLAEDHRRDRAFGSPEEAIAAWRDSGRLHHTPRELLEEEMEQHLALCGDGKFRYRYCQSAVVAAFGEMASEPPRFEELRIPTLVVAAASSYLVLDEQIEAYRDALGDALTVARVPGGHHVLWDAFEQTANAIEAFLR